MSTLRSEYYQPGDVIHKGQAFLYVLHHDLWDKICANCHKSNACLKKCGACKIMNYCGKSCQKAAWPDHKLECPFLRNVRNIRGNQTLVQLVGNTILKLKGKDWKTITERLMDNEISFDDLVSHTGTKNDPRLLSDIKTIKDDVESYIGKENLPNERILLEIIGKVLYNNFPCATPHAANECQTYFIGASKLDHSCVPNSTKIVCGKTIEVRATKVFHKSEKVTIAYGNLITELDSYINLQKLKNCFLESCYCSDCSQPFGKSPLTNIIDQTKAASVLQETQNTLQLMSLLVILQYPIDIVTRDKLSQLLQKQEGVLGKTNMFRIQILAIKALFKSGPIEDTKKDLLELADIMKEVWGENFQELLLVYQELKNISVLQNNLQDISFYSMKIAQLLMVCYGLVEDTTNEQFKKFLDDFRILMRR